MIHLFIFMIEWNFLILDKIDHSNYRPPDDCKEIRLCSRLHVGWLVLFACIGCLTTNMGQDIRHMGPQANSTFGQLRLLHRFASGRACV